MSSRPVGEAAAEALPHDPLLPRHWLLPLSSLAAMAGAILRVAIVPVLVGSLFDQVLVEGRFDDLARVLLVGAAVTMGGALALWLQDAGFGRLAAVVAASWRDGAYRSLLARNALRSGQSSGGVASRIVADLKEAEVFLQYGMGSLVAEAVTIAAILAYLFVLNPLAAAALMVLAVPLALVQLLLGRRVETAARETLERTEEVGSHLQEGLGQLEVARAFGLSRFLRARLAPDNRAVLAAQTARAAWAALQTPAAQVMGYGALAVLVVILTGAVQRGDMTLGDVTSFVALVALLGTPIQLLPRAWAMRKQAQAAAVRLRALLGPLPDGAAPAEDGTGIAAAGAERAGGTTLVLDDLGFAFEDGQEVLKNLDATFTGPALVVLTGESGAGKSTLLRLLLGLLVPASGRILLDGRDLASLSDDELRRRISYVPQDAALYRTTIRENLDLGRGLGDAAVWNALERVGMAETVRALDDGLAYRLTERGGGLSGGQRQRLALARALLGEPDVLLLDEPTSNLDAASEAAINATLLEEAGRRLVLTTTHRPALLDAAATVLHIRAARSAER